MLYSAKDIRKCKINAKDGTLGSVHDVFFDDRTWSTEYVVVDTGKWLPGKRVLIPRDRLGTPDWKATELDVDLTRDEIENSPGIESDPPLAHARSRYYQSYVWTSYPWGGFIGGAPVGADPAAPARGVTGPPTTHVRSAREITGYRIEARDGRIGHVDDFLFLRQDWGIQFVVIDTRNWLPGEKVVVPPRDIVDMEWTEEKARVDLTKKEIKSAPKLEPSKYSKAVGQRLMVIR